MLLAEEVIASASQFLAQLRSHRHLAAALHSRALEYIVGYNEAIEVVQLTACENFDAFPSVFTKHSITGGVKSSLNFFLG